MNGQCKQRYIKIADKEAEARLDKLLAFLEEHNFGFYTMSEKSEGEQKFVQVLVDIKVTANSSKRKMEVVLIK